MNDILSIKKLPHTIPDFKLSDRDACDVKIVSAFEAIKEAHKKGEKFVTISNDKPFSIHLQLWFSEHGYMTSGDTVRIDKSFDQYIEDFPFD